MVSGMLAAKDIVEQEFNVERTGTIILVWLPNL
jgi:hypothetical protein